MGQVYRKWIPDKYGEDDNGQPYTYSKRGERARMDKNVFYAGLRQKFFREDIFALRAFSLEN